MTWINRIVGLAFILLGIPLWLKANEYPDLGNAFPQVVIGVIVILSVVLVARSFVSSSVPSETGDGRLQSSALVRPLAVMAATAIVIYLMPLLGYFPAAALLALALFFVLRVENRLLYIGSNIAALLFIFLVFAWGLGIPLDASRIIGG